MTDSELRAAAARGESTPLSFAGWLRLMARALALVGLIIVFVPLHYLYRVVSYGSPFPMLFLRYAARVCGAKVEVIGTRHAEKVSEALASREELARAEDLGDYFRIPAVNRDLNYSVFVDEGDTDQTKFEDYDSHTVERLTVADVEQLLLTLPEMRAELAAAGRPVPEPS